MCIQCDTIKGIGGAGGGGLGRLIFLHVKQT